jgi:hypothetical protein
MDSIQQMQVFLQALGPFDLVTVGNPGSERMVIVIQGQAMDSPRMRHRQVQQVRGTVTQAYYVKQRNVQRWAFAEEDTGNSNWLVFHLWSEPDGRWYDKVLFRTLRQLCRGHHRVDSLHGRKLSISYSRDLEGQIVLVKEELDGLLWWVFYVEGPDSRLIHMLSLHVVGSPTVVLLRVCPIAEVYRGMGWEQLRSV